MAGHNVWDQIAVSYPVQADPGDAGTFICDRYHNYLGMTSGAGAETRTIQVSDKPCELVIELVTDGGGDVAVDFEAAAFDSSSNVLATFGDAGDALHMRALPNRRGWRLVHNDGTTLS
jgi:hypothetical protein